MGRDGAGELEHLVLLAILRLGDGAYGVPIVDEITERTGRNVSRASVYVVLRRLGQKGLVSSHKAEPTPERGGRAKRYFELTPEGLELVRESRRALLNMWEDVAAVRDA